MTQDPHPNERPEAPRPPEGPGDNATRPMPPPQQPYGSQPQQPYGSQPQQPYGSQPQPNPYAAPAAYGYQVPPAAPANTSAIVLTIVSGLSILLCACFFAIVPLIFGILGITHNATDPAKSAQMTRYGWISFGVCVLIVAVIAALGIAFFMTGPPSSTW